MSNPIDKLDQTCEIIGDKCKQLIQDRKDNKIDKIGFVNKYFDLLETLPNKEMRKNVVKDLDIFAKENFISKERLEKE